MRSITTATTLAMILAFGGMAVAQDTEAETETEETLPTLDDLTIGEPVGPQIGQPYVLQEYDRNDMFC